MGYAITTQRELRAKFWEENPGLDRRKITDHSGTGKMHVADTRTAFSDFVDSMVRDWQISPALADRATL